MSSSLDFGDYEGGPPVHPSMGGRALSGLDEIAYKELFTDGTQTTCAAGNNCNADACMDIKASTHRCMGCSLDIHCAMMCCQFFDEWWRNGFDPSLLPPYGQAKLKQYNGRMGETGLSICHRCINNYDARILSSSSTGTHAPAQSQSAARLHATPTPSPPAGLDPITRCISDIDAVVPLLLSPNSVEDEATYDAIVNHVGVDWKEYRNTITWQDFIVSAAAVHRIHKPANSVLTQLKGLRVKEKSGFVETWTITTDIIRGLSRKLGASDPGNHKKEYVCEKLVEFRIQKDEDNANGIVVPTHIARNKNRKLWNTCRFINVFCSAEFKDRFASRGRSLNKDQLDAREKTDQKLYTDLMSAYNITSKYGVVAYNNTAGITADPAKFEPVDPDDWMDGKKFFNGLMKDYEKLMRIVTKSGSHGSFEEVVLTQDRTTNPFMIYLHQHMLENKSMFEACVGCLHAGTAFESTPGGSLNSADDGNQKRLRSAGGAGRKKKSWLAAKSGASNGYIDALTDKAALAGEMLAMEKQKLEMDMKKTKFEVSMMKVDRAQLTVDNLEEKKEKLIDKRHLLRKDIIARHGEITAREKIGDMRQRKKERMEEGKSSFSLSQDSIIDRYLECEDSIMEVVSKHEDVKKTLADVSRQEKENLV